MIEDIFKYIMKNIKLSCFRILSGVCNKCDIRADSLHRPTDSTDGPWKREPSRSLSSFPVKYQWFFFFHRLCTFKYAPKKMLSPVARSRARFCITTPHFFLPFYFTFDLVKKQVDRRSIITECRLFFMLCRLLGQKLWHFYLLLSYFERMETGCKRLGRRSPGGRTEPIKPWIPTKERNRLTGKFNK